MNIVRIYMGNTLRNYCHLIACEETGEAIIVDPLDVKKCLAEANRLGLSITTIVNTHEHFDHIEGNPGIVEATGAKILAHNNAVNRIPNVDQGLSAGDIITVGNTVRLRVLDTPGHTMAHVCLVSEIGAPALICGDTLFNASAGNCLYGGNVHDMYQTFVHQLAQLPDNTAVYPGHDYIENNLRFSLSVEANNHVTQALLAKVEKQSPEQRQITTIAIEKSINPFFRLDNEEIIAALKQHFPTQKDDPESVFTHLRAIRDRW
ncbi:hydroxyacylglutathione hydrolase [Gammaproteobacteria bacterium 45_16_T64]|nr:hydroxyacylglutathione hydrolase [Gammaproteobacteria bacterium 45_16_T64]